MTLRAAALVATALASLVFAGDARAAALPTRGGETGFVEVPSAEVVGAPGGLLGVEFRFDRVAGAPDDFGPYPVYGVAGVTERLEAGFSIRQGGAPGDERPARPSLGLAAKLKLLDGDGPLPAIAVDATFDRLNGAPIAATRLILSRDVFGYARLGAFAGVEKGIGNDAALGPTVGGALSISPGRGAEAIVEALSGPRGLDLGAALRWSIGRTASAQLGFNYLPGDEGMRVSVGVVFSRRRPKTEAVVAPPGAPAAPVETPPAFTDARPRFRLRIPTASVAGLGRTRSQHGPYAARVAAAPAPAAAPETAGTRAAAPTLEDLADAQLRDQVALADARQKRVLAAAEQLDAREEAASKEASRLAQLERDLTKREQQLELREKQTVVRTPSEPQRQLESLAAQIAAEERNLAAQEKSFAPALDAASGRERAAVVREQEESAEAARLASSVRNDMPRAAQVELRKQALAARNRQLAAMETRLLARGERVDASERQLRTRTSRVEAWSRRLDARVERLDLIDKLLAPGKVTPVPAAKPPDDKGAALPPKDKPAFVLVVKAPTATLKAGSGAADRAAAGGATPSVSAEKAVIAATVVMFPTPATQMSELDRETLDNIAKLAAKSSGELLIWARAKDPSLVPEAERRAAEIRARAVTAGPLDTGRISTRVTMRPGAMGVDVVVSALRETAKPRAEEPERGGAPRLEEGESGKRQLRDAVQAAQPSIEACVAEHLQRKRMTRGEGTLKVTVSPQGRVLKTAAGADFAGDEVEACLAAASDSWRFPAADAEYVVDVPITVMGGGANR